MGTMEMAELMQLLTLSRTDQGDSGVVKEELADSPRSNNKMRYTLTSYTFPSFYGQVVGARED